MNCVYIKILHGFTVNMAATRTGNRNETKNIIGSEYFYIVRYLPIAIFMYYIYDLKCILKNRNF